MVYGEYITSISDYENTRRTAQDLPPALRGQISTSLCKEKIRLNNFKRRMPKNALEEKLFWGLSSLVIKSSDEI